MRSRTEKDQLKELAKCVSEEWAGISEVLQLSPGAKIAWRSNIAIAVFSFGSLLST